MTVLSLSAMTVPFHVAFGILLLSSGLIFCKGNDSAGAIFPIYALKVPVAAVIPIRSFQYGKDRLSAALAPESRTSLSVAMAERTIAAAEEALLLPIIVTAAHDVTKWASDLGLVVIADPGSGLDSAATAGTSWATLEGLMWMVLHADLPLILPDELAAAGIVIEQGRDLIAPSSDGGTSAVSSAGTMVFAYGPGSFRRHLPRLSDPVILIRLGTLLDLDSPDDLHAALAHPLGSWLRPLSQPPDDSAGSGKQI